MNNALLPEDLDLLIYDDTEDISFTMEDDDNISFNIDDSSIGGDYPPLTNKPKINDVTLIGNKTGKDLHLQDEMDALSVQEIERILYLD